MTREEKELLLKDLCARVPYGVKVNNEIKGDFKIYGICNNFFFGRNEVCHIDFDVEKIKPYLFPLSSMTEEQKYEYDELIHSNNIKSIEGVITSTDCSTAEIDWLLKNNFDFRGLIPKGLAIDATNKNIY